MVKNSGVLYLPMFRGYNHHWYICWVSSDHNRCTTEERLGENGVCDLLSGWWVHVVFLPWDVTVSGHRSCDKAPRLRRQRGESAMMRDRCVCGHCEHVMHAMDHNTTPT
jgi:hypothetical protein